MSKISHTTLCAFLCFFFFYCASSTLAQSKNSEEEPVTTIVVTANRYPTELEQTGSSVTIVNRKELEKKAKQTVLETLRSVPGIEVSQTGGPGRTTSVFIRGGESDHTLVLVDGIRVNDNATGQFDFANLTTDNIEQIEILRGPQSVLYGSEAIAGVIHIITRKGEEGAYGNISAEAGSYGSMKYRAGASGGSEKFRTSNTVSYRSTDGLSAAASNRGNGEDDSYENLTLSSRNSVEVAGDGKVDFSARYSSAMTEIDGFDFLVGPTDDDNFEQESDELVLSLAISKQLSSWLEPSIELGFLDGDLKGSDPDTEFNNFTIDNQNTSIVTKLDFTLPWNSILTVGHSFENRETENLGNFEERRDINSFFLQKQIDVLERLFVTGGARFDDDSDFGEEVTYRLTLAYLLAESGTRVHSSYGTGFKAPSFNELFFPGFGNPDLDAETSWGYDIGVEQELFGELATLDVTFFQNETEDLITFDTETFLASNIEEAKSSGFETTLSLVPNDWVSAHISHTYTDSENVTTGGILPRRPRHKGAVGIDLSPTASIDTSLELILVNSRRDSDGTKLDNYEVINMAASYSICENIKTFLRMDNLLDEDYEEVNGYDTAGFSAYAGVDVSF